MGWKTKASTTSKGQKVSSAKPGKLCMLFVCQECPEHPRLMLHCTVAPDTRVLQACPCGSSENESPHVPVPRSLQISQTVESKCLCCAQRVPASLEPGMQCCPCPASQHMVQEGWALWSSALHCLGTVSSPELGIPAGLPNSGAVPPPQHRNTWKGLNLLLKHNVAL